MKTLMGDVFEELVRKFAEISNETAVEHFTPRDAILPRVSDGLLLFLLHLISKMRAVKDGGSRFGIVLNGSPLFTGGAGSNESEIRRYVLENDLVEANIGLPTDMFYNTGISTYVWIVSNRQPNAKAGPNRTPIYATRKTCRWTKTSRPTFNAKSCRTSPTDPHVVYVNNVIKGKLLESTTLQQQAGNNTKEKFANSPDLMTELVSAIMAALDAHTAMSEQALDSEAIRVGLKEVLLGPGMLYEALRELAHGGRARV